MKSIEELKAIRDRARASVNVRGDNSEDIRIVVGMATCGIAAGARPVLNAFVEEINARGLSNVIVTQTGCAGHCKDEPTVEITLPGRRPVLYGHVTAERVAELVERQIVRGETAEGLIEA